MAVCKIPGIGLIDRKGGNALFHPNRYCHDLSHAADFVTRAWTKVKQPRMDKGADFIIATHRGVWGDNLGAGNPENSIAAIRDTKIYTDVLESDVMPPCWRLSHFVLIRRSNDLHTLVEDIFLLHRWFSVPVQNSYRNLQTMIMFFPLYP